MLDLIMDNGMCEGWDRQKVYFEDFVEKFNNVFGKDVNDKDKVVLVVYVLECLWDDKQVMVQVENNIKEQVMKVNLFFSVV